ncbi:hypothetical protein [Nocardia sp. NBC_00416]|uniref:hypothetical protein n=1 Tax=Nocardia sp. NBC_00416 TaxID=2975991 RepID=UPI002E1C2B22
MLKYLSAAAVAAVSGLALTVAGGAWSADAEAAALPGVPADVQVHGRLAVLGADRPDAVALGEQACATLHANPTSSGKRAAQRQLAGAGVAPGVQEGWVLGTTVDVLCPDMVPVVTAAD